MQKNKNKKRILIHCSIVRTHGDADAGVPPLLLIYFLIL